MGVACNRVRAFDTGEMMTQDRRHNRGSAPGRVCMKPKPSISTKICNLGQRIDCTGRRSSGSTDDHEGQEAILTIVSYLIFQIFHIHPERSEERRVGKE